MSKEVHQGVEYDAGVPLVAGAGAKRPGDEIHARAAKPASGRAGAGGGRGGRDAQRRGLLALYGDYTRMSAYDRHVDMMRHYVCNFGTPEQEQMLPNGGRTRTDMDAVRKQHQFLRPEEERPSELSWESRLARRYYDKLFKEFAIVDLSRASEGKVGMRWRTEEEVIMGKGQFLCGGKRCGTARGLHTYETHFVYREGGEVKQALVKVRLCAECGGKLVAAKGKGKVVRRSRRQERKRAHRTGRGKASRSKRRAKASGDGSSSDDSSSSSSSDDGEGGPASAGKGEGEGRDAGASSPTARAKAGIERRVESLLDL